MFYFFGDSLAFPILFVLFVIVGIAGFAWIVHHKTMAALEKAYADMTEFQAQQAQRITATAAKKSHLSVQSDLD